MRGRKTIAVIACYVMLLVLVCPAIPTPTYTAKDKSAGGHAALPLPIAEVGAGLLLAAIRACHSQSASIFRGPALVDVTCQRLC